MFSWTFLKSRFLASLGMTTKGTFSTSCHHVYILTGPSRVLDTGVTSSLERRVWEHKQKLVKGFSQKYKLTQLVYFETGHSARGAIAREKQIKGLQRRKKIALIDSVNPH